jgi:hypothetical protein
MSVITFRVEKRDPGCAVSRLVWSECADVWAGASVALPRDGALTALVDLYTGGSPDGVVGLEPAHVVVWLAVHGVAAPVPPEDLAARHRHTLDRTAVVGGGVAPAA